MSAYYSTDAWLLAARNTGEADRLITFFTKELGRVDAIAKGARLAKAKLKGHLVLFARLRILVTRGKEFWRLLDAEYANGLELCGGLPYMQNFAQFFGRLVSHGLPDESLWEVLSRFGGLDSHEKLVRLKLELLAVLGLLPASDELGQFFSGDAVGYIADTAISNPEIVEECELGIEKILIANHVL